MTHHRLILACLGLCPSLSLSLGAVGCGSTDPGRPFYGTWSFTSGNDNVSCPNGTTSTRLSGSITVKPASDGGLLIIDPDGCNFTYALDGQRASVSGRHDCSFPVPELGTGVVANVTYDTITLTTTD